MCSSVRVTSKAASINVLEDQGVLMVFSPIMPVPLEGREAFYGWLELAAALGRMRPPPPAVDGSGQVTLLGDGSLISETGQL